MKDVHEGAKARKPGGLILLATGRPERLAWLRRFLPWLGAFLFLGWFFFYPLVRILWVGLNPTIHIDDKGRPVVGAEDHKTGWHHLVLEKGKWTELVKSTSSPTSNQTAKPNDEDEDDGSERVDVSKLALPYVPFHLNQEYLQEKQQ